MSALQYCQLEHSSLVRRKGSAVRRTYLVLAKPLGLRKSQERHKRSLVQRKGSVTHRTSLGLLAPHHTYRGRHTWRLGQRKLVPRTSQLGRPV